MHTSPLMIMHIRWVCDVIVIKLTSLNLCGKGPGDR